MISSPFSFLWKLFDISGDSGIWDSLLSYMCIGLLRATVLLKNCFCLLVTVLCLQDCIHSEVRHKTTCGRNSHSGAAWHHSCRCVVWPLVTSSHATTFVSCGTPAPHNAKGGSSLVMSLGSSSEGCFCHWDPFSFGGFIMDEVRNCRSVLVKFVSSVFGLEICVASQECWETLPSAVYPSL